MTKIVFFIMFIVVLGFALIFNRFARDSMGIKAMVKENITTEFHSFATEIRGLQHLTVAELTQMEVFERTSTASTLFDRIKLPDVVVSISAPVSFHYFFDFKKPWSFALDQDILVVTPPPLEFDPPAADISQTEFIIKKGSLFRDEAEVMSKLQKEITPLLNERAEKNKELVLDRAKQQAREFVFNWLKQKSPKEKDPKVEVRFQP